MILENTLKQGSQFLKKNNISSHQLDAQIILSNIMKVTKEYLILNNVMNVSDKIREKYKNDLKRRINGEPVAYITGNKEFWSQNFMVNYSTLIPRPETELLIYKLVHFFKNKKINILDIGTGSGCILLSILKELNFSTGIGIDISVKAILTANRNANKLNLLHRSKFKVFDINEFSYGKYDLIVSNPPYIALRDIKNLSKDILNYEPLVALKGGIDGLDLIKKVIYKSIILLKRNGLLAIEIGNQQYIQASRLLKRSGFREIRREYDNNRNVRCIIGTKL
jgi:release factor glutamine methyltransferase